MHPSVPQLPFLTPIQQKGNHQAVPSSKIDTAHVLRAARGSSGAHQVAQSRSRLDVQMFCEMRWHTLLVFLEYIDIKDRYIATGRYTHRYRWNYSQLYEQYKLWDATYPWYSYSDYIFSLDASYHLISFLFTALMGNQFPGPRMRKAAEEHTCGSGCQFTSTKKRTPIKLQWSSLFLKAQIAADIVAVLHFLRPVPKHFTMFRKQKSNTQLSTDRRLPHLSAPWATELPPLAEQKMTPLPSSQSLLREVAPLKVPLWSRSVV